MPWSTDAFEVTSWIGKNPENIVAFTHKQFLGSFLEAILNAGKYSEMQWRNWCIFIYREENFGNIVVFGQKQFPGNFLELIDLFNGAK